MQSSQNGDVQLSVTLDTKGIKSDVQKLREEIKNGVKDKQQITLQIDKNHAVSEAKEVADEIKNEIEGTKTVLKPTIEAPKSDIEANVVVNEARLQESVESVHPVINSDIDFNANDVQGKMDEITPVIEPAVQIDESTMEQAIIDSDPTVNPAVQIDEVVMEQAIIDSDPVVEPKVFISEDTMAQAILDSNPVIDFDTNNSGLSKELEEYNKLAEHANFTQPIIDAEEEGYKFTEQELANIKAVTAEAKRLSEQFNSTAQATQQIQDADLAVRDVERLKTALHDTDAIAKDMAYDLEMFSQGNKYSEEFIRLKTIAQDLTKEFNKSADEMYKMEILGDRESAEFSELAIKTAEMASQLREVNGMLDDMRKSGEAYTEGVNNAELKQVEKAYDSITNKITLKREAEKRAAQEAKDSARQEAQATREAEKEQARLAKEAERAGKSMQQVGNHGSRAMTNTAKNTKKLNKELKETNTHGKKLKLNFLNLLGAAIGIRSLYALFSKLKSAVTDSLKTLAQWNNGNNKTNESISMLMNSLNELKNSFGAAFAPILTAVAPALNYLINLIIQAVNAIAQLIAYLSGSNTWIKAKKQTDDYTKSLNKTGAAAKNAAGKLAAFDDLNVLGKDNEDGGAGGIDPNKLFEEVPIESWVEELFAKLKAMLEKLLPILEHIWDVFKKGFWDAAKDIKARIADIIKNLKKIKDYLIEIFTDPLVVEAMKGWFDSIVYLLGSLIGAIALIGVSIAQNLVGGIEKYLSEHKDDIKQYLINMFNVWEDINKQLASFEQAFANIFSAIGDENGQQVTANIIGIFAGLFGDITLLASKLGRDLLELITKPIIDNQDSIRGAFDGLLGSLAIVTNAVQKFTRDMGSAWNELYDAHIGPFIDSITEGISGLVSTFLQVWETTIQPILNDLATDIDSLLNEYIKPFCEDILDIIGAIIDLLKFLWEVVLQPLMNWVIANILPPVTQIITGIMKLFEALWKVIFTILSAITGALKLLLDFVKDVFEKDWSTAFKNLKDNTVKYMREMGNKILGIWDTINEGIGSVVNGIIELFENFVNGAIDGINFLINAINALIENSAKLPSSIGLHIEPIPNLEHVTIPKVGTHGGGMRIPALAQGAVIPPNKEFLAMLGDQRQGTNIEAPLDTIRDAFQDVVSNMQVQNTGYAQMELDGETFARLIVPYVISELNREGYDLSVIGV